MTHPRFTALLIAALFCLTPFVAHAEHDLSHFVTGEHATGPKFSGKQIKGKVVVLEYWGITCGPCLRAIPHTTELAKKYGHDKLIIIANQVWSASNQRTADKWNEHAKNNMVMVVNGGSLKGFRPSGVPRALIFDHTGKSVWEGHPGGMDRALADAIANLPEIEEAAEPSGDESKPDLPEPIVTGFEPEHYAEDLKQINEQPKNISATLAKLRRATERAKLDEQQEEAKAIVAKVEAWVNDKQGQAYAVFAEDPATAYAIATGLIDRLGSDELADGPQTLLAFIEQDKKLLAGVRATLALRSILAQAESIGLDKDASAADEKDNARAIQVIRRDLKRLIEAYPESDAGKQAKTLQQDWGLAE